MCNNNITEQSLEKWKTLIQACKNYYIDSLPTGMSDSEFDELELKAIKEDGFFARDYVFNTYLKGTKTKNSWIEKIKKKKVEGISMLDALRNVEREFGEELLYDLKYDGASIAIYIDPTTGTPMRIVTVGNLNLDNYGVDQTWKLISFLPKKFPKGIVAIQAEALVDLNRLGDSDPDTARQKANGLVNSKYLVSEVNNYLTLRAYRFYIDPNIDKESFWKSYNYDFRNVINSFEITYSPIDGHILFAPASIWTLKDLESAPGYTETLKTITPTGYFLNDGWVMYNKLGVCIGALKYSGAGNDTELVKTEVLGIQWNSQVAKGKDSWSANILINPIQIKGCTIKKPSAGSVSKMVSKKITPGSIVSIIMANSTIPMVGESFKEGNGDFQWPTCPCGYTMSEKDVYGSLLKCGNQLCSERIGRMRSYLSSLQPNLVGFDLNKYLVIDRFKWENTNIDLSILFSFVENNNEQGFFEYLAGYLTTQLQLRNLNLVWKAGFIVLREYYEKFIRV